MIIDIIVILKLYSIDNGVSVFSTFLPNTDTICYNTDTLYTAR